MGPEKKGEDLWFTIPEAAEVLGITRQAVYAAISAGQLTASEDAYGKRIHAQAIIGYGLRTGRDPKELLNRIQEEAEGVDIADLLLWVLGGLGLIYLFKKFLGK